jgi:hypothetical protein
MIDPRIRKLNTSLDDYVIGYPPHPVERMQAFFFGTAIFPGGHRSCAAPRNVAVRADRNRRSYFRRVLVCICHGNGSEAMERNRTWRGLRVLMKRPIFRSIAVGYECADGRQVWKRMRPGRCRTRPSRPVRGILAPADRNGKTGRHRDAATQAMRMFQAASADLRERWRSTKHCRTLDRADPPRSI